MTPEDKTAIILKYGMPPPIPQVLGDVQYRKEYILSLPEYFLIDFGFYLTHDLLSAKYRTLEVDEIIEMLHRFDQYEERRASTSNP